MTAADLWTRGDQREALRAVRRAAWGCSKAGDDVRALALSKAAKAIQGQLDAAAPEGGGAAQEQPPTRRDTPHSRERVVPAGARSEPRPSKRPRPSRKPPGRQSSPNQRAASKKPPPPAARPATSRADLGAAPRSGPQATPLAPALADSEVELDLVVTVAPGGWRDMEAATLVGHRAARVAVAPVEGKKGTFLIRVLGAGEVAPANSAIALLVALEGGTRKVSRAG